MVVLSWVVSRLLAANAALVPFSTFPKSLFGKVFGYEPLQHILGWLSSVGWLVRGCCCGSSWRQLQWRLRNRRVITTELNILSRVFDKSFLGEAGFVSSSELNPQLVKARLQKSWIVSVGPELSNDAAFAVKGLTHFSPILNILTFDYLGCFLMQQK